MKLEFHLARDFISRGGMKARGCASLPLARRDPSRAADAPEEAGGGRDASAAPRGGGPAERRRGEVGVGEQAGERAADKR
jgi:hypothetical protein